MSELPWFLSLITTIRLTFNNTNFFFFGPETTPTRISKKSHSISNLVAFPHRRSFDYTLSSCTNINIGEPCAISSFFSAST